MQGITINKAIRSKEMNQIVSLEYLLFCSTNHAKDYLCSFPKIAYTGLFLAQRKPNDLNKLKKSYHLT
jgi:hypothetical protein